MRESFSTPEQFSNNRPKEKIEEGIEKYLISENPENKIELETIQAFKTITAEKPLTRRDFESGVEKFVGDNFNKLAPLLASRENRAEIIEKLKLTNEQIGLLGANYFIRKQNGEVDIYETYEYYPEGRYVSDELVSASDLLALAYVRDAVRLDTARDVGRAKEDIPEIPHRYYLKSKNRYLCNNDFGMRIWDDEKKEMADGNITNIAPFVATAKREFERIAKNIGTVGLEKATESEANRKLVLRAISRAQVEKLFVFKADKIAREAGIVDFDRVDLSKLFDQASRQEATATINTMWFLPLSKQILLSQEEDEGNEEDYDFIDFCKTRIKEALARKAVENNPKLKEIFEQCRCLRDINSGVYYSDDKVYDIIRSTSPKTALDFFNDSDHGIVEKLQGLEILKNLGYTIQNFEGPNLAKQTHQAATLSRSGVWRYLEQRETTLNQEEQDTYYEKWLAKLPRRKRKKLFREAKRMYWLAKQVWMATPNRREKDRFYRDDWLVNWDRYDLTKADVSEEKFNEYLEKQKNLIVALLGQGSEDRYGEQKDKGKSATLGLIVQALEQGNDIRGVALAHDKQRYLEGVISGKVKNDLEFAIEDWPDEWRKAVSPAEINLYYEYASDYVLLDPNGLTKYATWRATSEGKEWDKVFKETPKKKTDLDFRICLGTQTEDVRDWYKGAAEYVGGAAMQNYLLRFNTTRGADGRISNWHDVLLWSPNIQKLEAGDAKSILLSIKTMDDNQEFVNLLPRYSKYRDPLKNSGPIQSLRELKKRILAIESNIDLSKFPPELLEITSAPGFNLAALESMRRRADFQDLFEGKLDKEQPFRPHSRTFVGCALTEALREGLGSQKQKIRGTAKDPKGLFHALNQLVKGREIGEKKMTALDLLNSVPMDLEEEVIRLLREQQVDVGPIVEAQVHAKSDPEGWVCGNYTDCCMPFGASYNDDYMFNRSTQYFTIKYNGRIIAQSVVVDSRDRETGEDVVVLDNIEVADNYKKLTPLLSNVYQTFWTEYTSKPVKVGAGHSDLIPPGGKLEVNRYESKTQLSYSDARGSQIYDLPKLRGVESMDKVISFANLSERDAKLIAKMEAEAYPEGMAQGKAYIANILREQRELEVPGAASSFVVRQGQEAAGYLLVLPEESEVQSGERVAHVYDMVVMPKFRGSSIARKIMERVLDVASVYGVSIEAEARASTSYALLMNARIRKWFESKGFHLTKNEKLPQYLGGEDFYFIRLENRQNAEAVA